MPFRTEVLGDVAAVARLARLFGPLTNTQGTPAPLSSPSIATILLRCGGCLLTSESMAADLSPGLGDRRQAATRSRAPGLVNGAIVLLMLVIIKCLTPKTGAGAATTGIAGARPSSAAGERARLRSRARGWARGSPGGVDLGAVPACCGGSITIAVAEHPSHRHLARAALCGRPSAADRGPAVASLRALLAGRQRGQDLAVTWTGDTIYIAAPDGPDVDLLNFSMSASSCTTGRSNWSTAPAGSRATTVRPRSGPPLSRLTTARCSPRCSMGRPTPTTTTTSWQRTESSAHRRHPSFRTPTCKAWALPVAIPDVVGCSGAAHGPVGVAAGWPGATLHAGGTDGQVPPTQLVNKQRALGVLMTTESDIPVSLQPLLDELATCGVSPVYTNIDRDPTTSHDPATRLRDVRRHEGEGGDVGQASARVLDIKSTAAAASSQSWFPEWLVNSYVFNDANVSWTTYGPAADQRVHAFGISAMPMQRPFAEHPSTWARQDISPGTPYSGALMLATIDGHSHRSLLQLPSGIQMAGPNLTPQTFQDWTPAELVLQPGYTDHRRVMRRSSMPATTTWTIDATEISVSERPGSYPDQTSGRGATSMAARAILWRMDSRAAEIPSSA